jgi:TonB family protein
MKRLAVVCAVFLFCLAVGPLAGEAPAPYAYHLRVVRVSGAGTDPGAALGWKDNGGIPVMIPSEEAWGTSEQLGALAHALGGDRADAVTGFYVTADELGAHFERRVYISDSVVDLSFEAMPPEKSKDEHQLFLKIDSPELVEPMAEARLLVRTERTVAIASPSPLENDWLVLAVTLVDQGRIADLRGAKDEIKSPEDTGVVKPKIIRKTEPRYPEAARKDQLSGHVVLMATIDKEGIPRAPMVLNMSPGAEELAASAVDAVKTWRYEPGTLHGKPVDVMFTVTVNFLLQ